jgi:RimJ/RimL family protein N-acetyltransferase/catechol 2,3-dioxygenase-like lactoylglutathione lyase family enzyme
MQVRRIDHVQLAMPAGGEDNAVEFYDGLLGIPHVAKPAHLAVRGGCWFERGDLKVHLGVEADFQPARKAHPALLVDDLSGLVELLRTAGVAIRDDEPLAGYDRVYVDDPFGNRIELLEPVADIAFRPLTVDDFGLLVDWFAEPAVAHWWDQPAEIESVTAKYLTRIDGTSDATLMWVAEVDGEPAGLLQSYRHDDYAEHDIAVGVPNAVGIDYLLGARHRGRGLGGRILREFARWALAQHPGTEVCVATPAIGNTASCAALERAGFTRSHECQPPDEPPAAVYVFTPNDDVS